MRIYVSFIRRLISSYTFEYTLIRLRYVDAHGQFQKMEFRAPYSFGSQVFNLYTKDDMQTPSSIFLILYDLKDVIVEKYPGHRVLIDEISETLDEMLFSFDDILRRYKSNLFKNPLLTKPEIESIMDEQYNFFLFFAYEGKS